MAVKKVNSGLLEFSEDLQVLVVVDEDGEVQKAVTIDEDGDETSFAGITPTGKINITQNGTNIDVAQYALADVAVPAPASDYTTATVTVNSAISGMIFLPNIYDDVETPENSTAYSFFDVTAGEPLAQEILLYKGMAIGVITASDVNIATTGDVEYDELNQIIIVTGAGTITITENNL